MVNRLYIPLLLLFAVIVVASLQPAMRLWGINHLGFHPPVVGWLGLALMAIAFVPPIGRGVMAALSRPMRKPLSRRAALVTALATGIAALLLFASFKSSTLLLGDGQLVANSLERLLDEHDSVSAAVREAVTADKVSPGTTVVYYLAVRAFSSRSGQSAQVVGRLNSVLGALLVGLLVYVIVRSEAAPETRLWLLLLTLFSGAIQLFFAYVENYALLMFFGALYVVFAVGALARGGAWWPAAIACVAAVGAHFEGLLLVPSLVFLIGVRVAGGKLSARPAVLTASLLGVTIIGAYIAGAHTALARFFLPLMGSDASYGVLSPAHGVDIANELLLLAPVLPLVAVLALWRGSEELALRRSSWLARDIDGHFVVTLLGPLVIYLLFFHPEIGMSRDWDLFSITVLGIVPAAIFAINRYTATAENRSRLAAVTFPAWVMMIVLTVSWVGINTSAARSTARLATTLEYDLSRADYVFENLAFHYEKEKRVPEAIAALERATELSKNPRYYFNLSQMYRIDGNDDMADQLLKRLLANQPDVTSARQILVRSLYDRKRCEELIPVARDGARVDADNPLFHYYLGKCLFESGDLPAARESLHAARQLSPPTSMLRDIHATLKIIRETLDG